MRIILIIIGVLGVVLGLALYGPGSIAAMRLDIVPEQAALTARMDAVTEPLRTERTDLHGAEDVEPGPDGNLYTSLADGRIMMRTPDGQWLDVANTGGRPLGLAFGPDGDLFVADALRGLLRWDGQGWEVWLADRSAGGPLVFTDDLTVLDDGRIILTDASLRHAYGDHIMSFLEADQTGRILSVSAPGEYSVLAEGLAFINGVDHDPATGIVYVNETWTGRIWSLNPDTGVMDVLVEGLPGYPDNLEFDAETGLIWSALPSLRSADLDALHGKPLVKRLVWRLLQINGLPELPDRPPLVVAVTPEGEVRHIVQGPVSPADGVTGVTVWNDELWMSGLDRDGFTIFATPD
ncbi:SMP-30/gluconolactonase/LRE family protein [Maricaulis parjimensis]|uniref:SMP-30/gluconolactonase/LRE family protein n=1 Tax=Maricaulis parjimensis TaxID=144023 RepID=UPI00193A5C5C|nr:SMP-30/gluconolactonase/LRE family protein [Maricaulis parjimensis]